MERASEVLNITPVEFNWYPDALGNCMILRGFGAWMFLTILLGILLNGIVIHLFASHKDLRSPTNAFIISIAICDFLACVLEIPLPMIANLSCKWTFGKFGCYFEGFIAYFVGCSSMYILSLVSIDRYIAIAKPLEHGRITYKVQIVTVLICYLNGFLWALFPAMGWSSYALEGALTSCSVQWQDKSPVVMSYNILMFFFVLCVPVSLMVICNFKLYMTIRHVARHGAWDLNDPKTKKKLEVEKRIAKTAMLMIFGFLFAWIPYATVALISAFGDPNSISPMQATLPSLFAKTQVIWNPLVYVVTNKNFRQKLPFFKTKVQDENMEMSHSTTTNKVAPKPVEKEVEADRISNGGTTTTSHCN